MNKFLNYFLVIMAIFSLIKTSTAHPPLLRSREACGLCTYAATLAENYVGLNTTEFHLMHIVEEGCSLLPPSLQRDCSSLVEKTLPEIISRLEARLPPSEACEDLHMCPRSRMFRRVINRATFYKFPYGTISLCAKCEAIVATLESEALNLLDSPEWNKLVKFCQDLPVDRSQVCYDFLAFYPIFINGFVVNYPPQTLCQDLFVC
jgi:hypothetical protein